MSRFKVSIATFYHYKLKLNLVYLNEIDYMLCLDFNRKNTYEEIFPEDNESARSSKCSFQFSQIVFSILHI